jgi:trk system potassium uptake protein TrkH
VVRRQPRETKVIQTPQPETRRPTSNPLVHARLFAFGLIIAIGIGTCLLLSPWATEPGQHTDIYDALFVSMSAATITGLATVDTATHWTFFGEAVILTLAQLGGLGFTVGASLVLLLLRREGSLRDALLMRDGSPTLTLREALEFSGRIIRFTFIVEAIGSILLTGHFYFVADMPFPKALWYGVFHAVCSFCNAGFDLSTNFASFLPYHDDILLNVTVMLMIQAGALSYIVFHDIWVQRSWRRLGLDTKLILTVNAGALLGGAAVFLAAEWDNSLSGTAPWARPMSAMFQSVAARTGGYATVNFAEVTTVTLLVWVGVMAIGGASGSTAGGIKLSTIGVIAVAVLSALRGQSETQIFGRRLASALVFRAMAVTTVFIVIYFAVVVSLSVTESHLIHDRYTTEQLLFEAMSALATTGLSTGLTAELSDMGKVIIVLAMFAGRLGPLSLAYALQGRQSPSRYRFPEEPVRIG